MYNDEWTIKESFINKKLGTNADPASFIGDSCPPLRRLPYRPTLQQKTRQNSQGMTMNRGKCLPCEPTSLAGVDEEKNGAPRHVLHSSQQNAEQEIGFLPSTDKIDEIVLDNKTI